MIRPRNQTTSALALTWILSSLVSVLVLGFMLVCAGIAWADTNTDERLILGLPSPKTTVGVGFDYSRGEFDTDADTTITSITPLIRLEWEAFTVRAALPFFDVRGVFDPTIDDEVESDRGVGDLTYSLSYTILPPRHGLPFYEFTTKIKFPTANSSFGTGEVDVTLLANITHIIGDSMLVFGDFGLRFRGGGRFRNTLWSSVGGGIQLQDGVGLWLAYDWRQSPIKSNPDKGIINPGDEHELVPFISLPIGEHLRLDPYLVIGLAKASPDWGFGTSISWAF